MRKPRRNHSAAFKARVALEAIRDEDDRADSQRECAIRPGAAMRSALYHDTQEGSLVSHPGRIAPWRSTNGLMVRLSPATLTAGTLVSG